MSHSATPAMRNEATPRLKPPQVTTFVALSKGTARRPSRRHLRTVADRCERLRTQTQGRANTPSTPRLPEWNGNPCYAFGKKQGAQTSNTQNWLEFIIPCWSWSILRRTFVSLVSLLKVGADHLQTNALHDEFQAITCHLCLSHGPNRDEILSTEATGIMTSLWPRTPWNSMDEGLKDAESQIHGESEKLEQLGDWKRTNTTNRFGALECGFATMSTSLMST